MNPFKVPSYVRLSGTRFYRQKQVREKFSMVLHPFRVVLRNWQIMLGEKTEGQEAQPRTLAVQKQNSW